MTRPAFWLIRHALVEENARAMLYGTMDVPLCPEAQVADVPTYRALAARLPPPGALGGHPAVAHQALTAEGAVPGGLPGRSALDGRART